MWFEEQRYFATFFVNAFFVLFLHNKKQQTLRIHTSKGVLQHESEVATHLESTNWR